MAEDTEKDVAAEITSSLEAFETENSDLVRELDLMGFKIDEYEIALANAEPRVILTTNTTLVHDME